MERLKRLYIAGPMRGIPEFNFPAFHEAAAWLRSQGNIVFSPAEKDIEVHGLDISKGNATGDENIAKAQFGFSLRRALGDDLAWICAYADGVVLLPGWQDSAGASAEAATAKALESEGVMVVEYTKLREVVANMGERGVELANRRRAFLEH